MFCACVLMMTQAALPVCTCACVCLPYCMGAHTLGKGLTCGPVWRWQSNAPGLLPICLREPGASFHYDIFNQPCYIIFNHPCYIIFNHPWQTQNQETLQTVAAATWLPAHRHAHARAYLLQQGKHAHACACAGTCARARTHSTHTFCRICWWRCTSRWRSRSRLWSAHTHTRAHANTCARSLCTHSPRTLSF